MRKFLAAWLLLSLCSPAFAALSIEGTASAATNGNCTGANPAVTTVSANDILTVVVGTNNVSASGSAPAVSSISTTGQASLSLTKRSAFSVQSAGAGTPWLDVEVWWALAAAAGTYTIHAVASADDCAVIGFGVAGANTSTPWDTNGSLTATANGTGSAPSITGVSTTCDKTMLLMAAFAANTSAGYTDQTAGTGFTIITNQAANAGTNFSKTAAQQDIVAVAQSGITTSFAVSWVGWIASVDAIRDATASCGAAANSGGIPLLMLGAGP